VVVLPDRITPERHGAAVVVVERDGVRAMGQPGTAPGGQGSNGGQGAMLVLSRFINERILIGDDIVVQVVDVRGDKVRLGIVAPPHVRVDREEVRERIDRERPRGGAA
jgi:carbon storage regulator